MKTKIAILPYVLGCILMCCMDKKDNKSSIAGGISALMAIGTGALGITAVVINSVECLAVSTRCFLSKTLKIIFRL